MSRATQDTHRLRLRKETRGNSVILHAYGDVDITTIATLADNLTTAEKAVTPPSPVILDLSHIIFLSAAGLATLVEHTRRCTRQGTPLRVVADQHAVLRPIELTGLSDTLNLHYRLSHALHASHDASRTSGLSLEVGTSTAT
jgi:anti-sigma B factor antagonist